jgi:hypothetical protein
VPPATVFELILRRCSARDCQHGQNHADDAAGRRAPDAIVAPHGTRASILEAFVQLPSSYRSDLAYLAFIRLATLRANAAAVLARNPG